MQYVFMVDKISHKCYGICRKNWLNKIIKIDRGNLYDDCIECDRIDLVKPSTSGWAWYITPSRSYWANIKINDHGMIERILEYK